ncbi:hypothetical protein GCM10025762_12530 [Haloechinothrix salitolerans]
MREHPGVQVVCRDGSGAYAEAIRRALPDAVQVADRWHLWHNLAEAALKEVAAHSACWGKTGPPPRDGKRAATTRERWRQVHDLLDRGVGLLEISRRLNLALNTVKRYARIGQPERLVRAPQYRPTLVDPFRDHLRQRREEDPGVPVLQLLHEITELGYTGSQNLLYRYITQGLVESDRLAISPKRLARYLLTHPDELHDHQRERIDAATSACPEMTMLAALISDFAGLLTPDPGNDERLTAWIDQARAEEPAPPARVHSRTRTRPPRRGRRPHPAIPQWTNRRSEHQNEADQATDVRTRRIPPPPPPHTPRMNYQASPLSRPGARCRDCSRSVSPGLSPNPPCASRRNGLSTVSVVRLVLGSSGWGSCCCAIGSG